jgi:hypothetical protein
MSAFGGRLDPKLERLRPPLLTDAVEKVPKYGTANFPLKDKTSGDRHSMGPQLDYGSHR